MAPFATSMTGAYELIRHFLATHMVTNNRIITISLWNTVDRTRLTYKW